MILQLCTVGLAVSVSAAFPDLVIGQACEPKSLSAVRLGTYGHMDMLISPYAISAEALNTFESAADAQPTQMAKLWGSRELMSAYYSKGAVKSIRPIMQGLNDLDVGPEDLRLGLLFYSYSPDQDSLATFLITNCGIEAYAKQSGIREKLESAITTLRLDMDSQSRQRERGVALEPSSASPAQGNVENTEKELSTILFPESFRDPMRSLSYLVIVPALDIGTVPFAILHPFGDETYLVDHLSVSVGASLWDAYLWLSRMDKIRLHVYGQRIDSPENTSNAVVVGNPTPAPSLHLPPLPGAENEARAVAQLVHGRLFLGPQATKAAVLSAVKGSGFVYFATHGVADQKDPMHGSFLALSGKDGRLTGNEIQFTPQFHDALVVLSACQSGLGKESDAGIMGIARSFQISGADVVMSLWDIDDEATADLMKAFVSNLGHETHADALRDAMIATRSVHPDPSRWGAFSVFGNPF
jgi:hypothetical protein